VDTGPAQHKKLHHYHRCLEELWVKDPVTCFLPVQGLTVSVAWEWEGNGDCCPRAPAGAGEGKVPG